VEEGDKGAAEPSPTQPSELRPLVKRTNSKSERKRAFIRNRDLETKRERVKGELTSSA